MNTPTPEFDDGQTDYQEEWLSAYLDDELTPAQRRIVEDRLSVDPGAQATLSDLEAIRGLVRQLPTWNGKDLTLSPDLLSSESYAASPSGTFEDDLRSTLESDDDDVPSESELQSAEAARIDVNMVKSAESTITQSRVEAHSSRGLFRWLRPLAIAASVLLMFGLGYVLWQSNAAATRLADSRLNLEEDRNLGADRNLEADNSPAASAAPAAGSLGESAVEDPAISSSFGLPDANRDLMRRQSGAGSASGAMQEEKAGLGSGGFGAPSVGLRQAEMADSPPASPQEYDLALSAQVPNESLAFRSIDEGNSNDLSAKSEADAETAKPSIALPMPAEVVAAEAMVDAEVTQMRPGAPALKVFLGRSSSWEDAAVTQELASNPTLSSLSAKTSLENEAIGPPGKADTPSMSPTPMILAQIPNEQDGQQLYSRLLVENDLQPVTNSSNDRSQLLRGSSTGGSSRESALQDTVLPGAIVSDLGDSIAGKNTVQPAAQAVVLFLNRVEAQSILQGLMEQAGRPAGQTPGIQGYMWINPANNAAANNAAANNAAVNSPNANQTDLQSKNSEDPRVILLLNSAAP